MEQLHVQMAAGHADDGWGQAADQDLLAILRRGLATAPSLPAVTGRGLRSFAEVVEVSHSM